MQINSVLQKTTERNFVVSFWTEQCKELSNFSLE